MSTWGPPPWDPTPPSSAAFAVEDRRRTPGWPERPPGPDRRAPWWLLVVVVVLALGAGVAAVLAGGEETHEWDPRVLDLVAFVESERGLDFGRAVPIDWYTEEEWAQEMRRDPSALSEDELREVEESLRLMRALGLAEGDVDLVELLGDFASSFFVAYYDPAEERIVVQGDEDGDLDPTLRATLVHELTHALQDQHFDLDRLQEAADEDDAFALTALIEGDAVNVEQAWIAQLSAAEQDEIFASGTEGPADAEEIPVPVAFRVTASAPYELGPGFAWMLRASSGALDAAFRAPPRSEEHVFDPASYLLGDEPRPVDAPRLPEGAREIDSGRFGAFGWYVMLAERLDAHVALQAADGWGGDAYVMYEHDSRVCVSVRYVGDTAGDTAELRAALGEWTASLPSTFAKVRDDGDHLLFQSCDPGADTVLETGRSLDAMVLPVARGQFFALIVDDGLPPRHARCVADRIVSLAAVDELADPEHEKWSSREFEEEVALHTVRCG